jgi:threonine aldolase
MFFISDNASGVPPKVLAALSAANDSYAMPYGNDTIMDRVKVRVREVFEAPDAAVYLVATGTAANALALATCCPPWGAVFCHDTAHINMDECGAPEFYTNGAKLALVPGTHGKMTLERLAGVIAGTGGSVHGVQRGMVSITNVTEVGSVYTPAEIKALTEAADGLPCHLDGARFANALVATGATAAEMTWKAGIDVVSFGGTKNGLLGAEAVVIFDPARAWEFELRRKRAGHLFSKHRYLSAQFDAYLQDDLWLTLAAQANAAGARLAAGLARFPGVTLQHPVQANMLFVQWPAGGHARLQAAGAAYYDMPAPDGFERARLVTSWCTKDAEVDAFLAALQA